MSEDSLAELVRILTLGKLFIFNLHSPNPPQLSENKYKIKRLEENLTAESSASKPGSGPACGAVT